MCFIKGSAACTYTKQTGVVVLYALMGKQYFTDTSNSTSMLILNHSIEMQEVQSYPGFEKNEEKKSLVILVRRFQQYSISLRYCKNAGSQEIRLTMAQQSKIKAWYLQCAISKMFSQFAKRRFLRRFSKLGNKMEDGKTTSRTSTRAVDRYLWL